MRTSEGQGVFKISISPLNKTFDNQLKKNIGSSLLNAVTIAEVGRMPSGVLGVLKDQGLMLTEGNQINNINC